MVSFYYLDSGAFAGNAFEHQQPSVGLGKVYIDPPEGMNNPIWSEINEFWIPGSDPIEAPPGPDWPRFTQSILTDTLFNQAYETLLSQYPLLANALPITFIQVGSGDLTSFKIIYSLFCNAAEVSLTAKEEWAELAKQCNCPKEFCELLLD